MPKEDASHLPYPGPGMDALLGSFIPKRAPGASQRPSGFPDGQCCLTPPASEGSRLPRRRRVGTGGSEWNSQGPWKESWTCGPQHTSQGRVD